MFNSISSFLADLDAIAWTGNQDLENISKTKSYDFLKF